MRRRTLCLAAGLPGLLLAACSVRQLPGYQNTFEGHQIPADLLERIRQKFKQYELARAEIGLDNVGRVRLLGRYRNEDEVERAFLIAQSIVGLRSTSPFYPLEVEQTRWEQEAARVMAEHAQAIAPPGQPALKRALVVGINEFRDSRHLRPIQGEDDARLVREQLLRAGYQVVALLGRDATKLAIEAGLRQLKDAMNPQDSLFIYISSHGNPPVPAPGGRDQRRMSIVAYDSGDRAGAASRDGTDYLLKLQASSVKDSLVQQVAMKPSWVTRVFIDTCYSGDILKDIAEDSRAYLLRANGGQVERAGVSLAAWSGEGFTGAGGTAAGTAARASAKPRQRMGYSIITATSEGQESLGPPVELGVFASPLDPKRMLRGSFFTQAYFDFLDRHEGQMQPAFEDSRRFTEQQVDRVSGGMRRQVPRQFSTLPAALDNLFR